MNRSEILATAAEYVTRDRAATHGDAERNFAAIEMMWRALDMARGGRERGPQDVSLYMAALKMVRASGNPSHDDNWIDLCGYGACGGEIATEGGV